MKIALFNCHARSIPPKKSGGIEKVMQQLITGLSERGHEVTLFSTGDSFQDDDVEVVSISPTELEFLDIDDRQKEYLNTKWTNKLSEVLIARQYEFDIIHNHCLGAGLHILESLKVDHLSTIHEELTKNTVRRLKPFRDHSFVSLSYAQREPFPTLNYTANIYNAIDVNNYLLPRKPEDFLVFVGRISKQKSPHLAILAARRLGMKLYILGKYKDQHIEADYYHKIFLPILQENMKYVEWIGEVDEKTVNSFFNKALCSIHPATFQDPCPLSPLESMANGCPVIAFNNGAYPELIANGKTGFIVNSVDQIVERVRTIDQIDRKDCRSYIAAQFDCDTMVEKYILAYKKILSRSIPEQYPTRFSPLNRFRRLLPIQ